MSKDLVSNLEEVGLYPIPHHYIPPSVHVGGSSKKTKKPWAFRRMWVGTYLVQLERFEGRDSVMVYDEAAGYDKKVAAATGLDRRESEIIFDEAVKAVKDFIGLGAKKDRYV